ncbi:hypothetical protein C1I95_17265 [Micromonospora craterilacus]|uniref:Uncharacterized protein n=1 Tax=Micromonospora craterilacus TaxID=1655439 RepID=A0A2W2DXL8_9ACTN|nr:DUF6506 family protein [Micromonospora craterilacus]PZG16542.1 hypothetical protein C1I95_17265 [Micromonospora craterilacus]
MTLSWAYIYEHPGSDPVDDRVVLDRDGQRTYLVPVPDPSMAPAVAADLVAEGVALIELCGGFALTAAARVVEAVGGRVPVGHVTFAVDSVRGATQYGELFEADQSHAD